MGPYKPRDVEEILTLEPATLRLWARQFNTWLSPSAQSVPKGSYAPRRYTERDVALLRRVKAARDSGFSFEQIRQSLPPAEQWKSAPETETETTPEPEPAQAVDDQSSAITVSQVRLALQALRDLADARQETAEARQETIDALHRLEEETQARRQAEAERDALKAELGRVRSEPASQLPAPPPATDAPSTPSNPSTWWARLSGSFKRFRR